MTTIVINERTKNGRSILETLKLLAKADDKGTIRFLDETGYLLSTEANKEVLMQGIAQVKKGGKGKTIKTSDLWK